MDLLTAGFSAGHIARHNVNRRLALDRRKFQDPLQRQIVVDCRSSGWEAADSCSCAPVSALTGASTDHIQSVAHGAISADTPRVQDGIMQSLGGNAAWIDGIGHQLVRPAAGRSLTV